MDGLTKIAPLLLLLLLVAIYYGYVFFKRRGDTRGHAGLWRGLAAQTGLKYRPVRHWGEVPRMYGIYRGHELEMDIYDSPTLLNRNEYVTRIVLKIENTRSVCLSISGEGLGDKIGKLLGDTEILTGDDELDRQLLIKGQPKSSVLQLLSNIELRRRLLAARSFRLDMDDIRMIYEVKGKEQNNDILLSAFDLMSVLADAVERMSLQE